MLQMVHMESSVRLDDLLKDLDTLKKKLEGKSFGPGDSAPRPETLSLVHPAEEVKVVGSVSAGRLKTAAAMTYAAFSTPSVTSAPPPATPPDNGPVGRPDSVPAHTASMSREAVQQHWPAFVTDVSRARIAVGTSLSESSPLDIVNGSLRIACPDDYNLSQLKRNKDFLSDVLFKMTGSRVGIDPILHAGTRPAPALVVAERTSSGNAPVPSGEDRPHPMLAVLKRELGAEPID